MYVRTMFIINIFTTMKKIRRFMNVQELSIANPFATRNTKSGNRINIKRNVMTYPYFQ